MGERSKRLLQVALGHIAVFGVAIAVSASCKVDYPTTAFRCSPSADDPNCPEGYQCCSDDPAALLIADLSSFVTPNYQGRGGDGTPLFSAGNNPLSTSGMCVETGSVPPIAALADQGEGQGCPVPCNPTWSDGDISAVCGAGQLCCQTVELGPADCEYDESIGCFRPVTGADISAGLTSWAGAEHDTHQDPNGLNCEQFVAGINPASLPEGVDINAVKTACYRRLTVANQRGFCLGVALCPLSQPTYRDVCEQMNDINGLTGCG